MVVFMVTMMMVTVVVWTVVGGLKYDMYSAYSFSTFATPPPQMFFRHHLNDSRFDNSYVFFAFWFRQ